MESGMQENEMRRLDMAKCTPGGISGYAGEEIALTGCLGQRHIGCAMKDGILHVEGTPGNAIAAYLDGGSIYVDGNVQDAAADTMNAGLLAVRGSAGDALAYGMRGGRVYVEGPDRSSASILQEASSSSWGWIMRERTSQAISAEAACTRERSTSGRRGL